MVWCGGGVGSGVVGWEGVVGCIKSEGFVAILLPRKDGPGPIMVSDTLCPAVHIMGT